MNFKQAKNLLKKSLAFAATAGVLGAAPVLAQNEPVGLDMSVLNSTFSLGEPIVLRYEITNQSSSGDLHYQSEDEKGWLTLSLVDSAGQAVPALPDRRSRRGPNLYGVGTGGLLLGKGRRWDYLIVSQWLTPPRAGKYTLLAQARFSYAIRPRTHTSLIDATVRPADATLTRNYAFPLTVTAFNDARLRAVAQSLYETAASEIEGREVNRSMGSLFSLPMRYALPAWNALLNGPKPRSSYTLYAGYRQIERVASPEVADFLAKAAWSAKGAPPQARAAREMLLTLHRDGDAAFKRHVEGLFVRHEGKMTTTPPFSPR